MQSVAERLRFRGPNEVSAVPVGLSQVLRCQPVVLRAEASRRAPLRFGGSRRRRDSGHLDGHVPHALVVVRPQVRQRRQQRRRHRHLGVQLDPLLPEVGGSVLVVGGECAGSRSCLGYCPAVLLAWRAVVGTMRFLRSSPSWRRSSRERACASRRRPHSGSGWGWPSPGSPGRAPAPSPSRAILLPPSWRLL